MPRRYDVALFPASDNEAATIANRDDRANSSLRLSVTHERLATSWRGDFDPLAYAASTRAGKFDDCCAHFDMMPAGALVLIDHQIDRDAYKHRRVVRANRRRE